MRKQLWYRAGPVGALGAALLLATSGGCGDNANPTDMAGPKPDMSMPGVDGGGGDMTMPQMNVSLTPATTGGDYNAPLDSVPDGKGATFYFTARNDSGAGVFKVAASGGTATAVAAGDPFAAPLGIVISADDKTLYVADTSAGLDTAMMKKKSPEGDEKIAPGGIYAVSTSGGKPTLVMGTAGYAPRGLYLAGDQLYFTGSDPADFTPGVFKVPAGGGNVTAVAKGAPFVDPSGLVMVKGGDLYVVDTVGGNGFSSVVKVTKDGAASESVKNIPAGYPAGIAATMDESMLLVSGQAKAKKSGGTSVVYIINLATKKVTAFNKGIETSDDSGGLHRAASSNVFSWCGVTVGDRGTVFQVTIK